jgi:hypothetical protein
MKPNLTSERGQALVLIALAIIGLVGITGLAIDGSMILADRRHAQNAADTSALAGALAKIKDQEVCVLDPDVCEMNSRAPMRVSALDRAESNGYTNDLVTSTVEVYTCDEADATCNAPYAGDSDYIQVVINSYVDTYFARIVGIPQLHNQVSAIARADDDDSGPLGNGEAIVSYSPVCEEPVNFTVTGGATVNVTGGGLFVNVDDPADSSCGFVCNSTAGEINGDITTVGGTLTLSDHCGENIDGTISDGTGSALDFPVTLGDIGLDVPSECSGDIGTYTNWSQGQLWPGFSEFASKYPQFSSTPITVIHPGRFNQFPPPKEQKIPLNDVMFLDPGVYCVGEVLRWNQPSFVLVGHDVTIFIKAGYGLALTGGIIDIDAPDSGDYAGYLIIVEPNYGDPIYSTNNPEACTINGNTNNNYTGTIFAPYCDCMIDGGSTPTGFNAQVLCYTVKIAGSSEITFTYDPGDNGEIDDPAKTGIAR